ncbi:zinc finger protein 431-like [Zerene cesonia]|uniref:zinc finger protein 431-like n=1 Tax=Zerene cesonia TaxID=33412 RepID=UPI0018E57E8C|nr:zinc finger protein 431-like [Zerene cesonia]
MDSIKTEDRDGICSGCLSMDRHTSVVERQDLFIMLLSKQTVYVEPKYLQIQLCWECKAMVKKIALFQKKINEAQFVLDTSVQLDQLNTDVTPLSTLNVHHNRQYDITIDHDQEVQEKLKLPEIMQRRLSIEVVKQETEDVFDYDIKDECSHSDSDKPAARKRNFVGKFERKAVITKNELDMKKLEKYFKKMVLDNGEIEEVLQRERECKRGKSQYRYGCKRCKMKYKRVIDVHRHSDFAHPTDVSPLHCSECKDAFDTRAQLNEHWKTHNVLYKCTFCVAYCRSKFEMNLHMVNTHSRLYTCKNCGMQIFSSQQFTHHYKSYHTKYICDDCGRVFGIKSSLEKHMMYVLSIFLSFLFMLQRATELVVRLILSFFFAYGKRSPLPVNRAGVVPLRMRNLSTAVAHVQRPPVKVPCPECGKIFSRNAYMKNHYKLVHVRSSSHYCEICNKHFVSGFSLRTHRKFVHEKTVKPKDKICDVCGRGFHTNRTLLNHKRTHTGERPYKCTYCPAAFAQSYARTTHERSQHKNVSDVFILPT